MSFEGWYQLLCKNGHESSEDCYYHPDYGDWKCPVCGAELAWSNLVDITNGSYCDCYGPDKKPNPNCEYCQGTGRIDGYVELEVDQPEQTQVCNLGHVHVTKVAIYKIPEPEEESK